MFHLGRMTPFYRNQAILNEFLSVGGLERGGELMAPPDYLLGDDIDFPYQRKPFDKEVLFADHITIVRFCGGVKDERPLVDEDRGGRIDPCYRDDNGKLQYRWKAIDRLDRFVEVFGSEMTIVLDNMPWGVTSTPHIDGYGQIAPPDDYDQWRDFITALCREFVRRYGFDTVSLWRFRMATEARLHTDTEGFCRHYDITVEAIRMVLPEVQFMPYNIASCGTTEKQNINMYAFAKHCVEGINYATGEKGSPVDFAPVSYYSFPMFAKDSEGNALVVTMKDDSGLNPWSISPQVRAESEYAPYWKKIDEIFGRSVPREIHELGLLGSEYGIAGTSEPGARGAAWLLQLLFHMREINNIQRAWHWHCTDVIEVPSRTNDEQRRLLRSNGWLYSILDHTIGGDTYTLDVALEGAGAADVPMKAVGFFNCDNGKSYIIASAMTIDRHKPVTGNMTVSFPGTLLPAGARAKLRATWMTEDTDVYTQVKADLAAQGMLSDEMAAHDHLIGSINGVGKDKMTDRKGMEYLDANWDKYETIIRESLKLKDSTGTLTEDGGNLVLSFPAGTPITMVVEMS